MIKKFNYAEIDRKFVFLCFIAYFILLSWAIVFKMNVPSLTMKGRDIVLIPFKDDTYYVSDLNRFLSVGGNIVGFVPAGILFYLIISGDNRFLKAIYASLASLGVSLFYEVIQYIFAIGVSATTDLIHNFMGGVIGVFIILMLELFMSEKTVNGICKWVFYILSPICIATIISTIVSIELYI